MQKPQIKICLFVLTSILLTGCTNPFPTSTKASSSTVATNTTPLDSPITSPTPTPTPTSTPTLNNNPSGSVALTVDEVKDILKTLIPKAGDIYGMFNGYGWFKVDKSKTIPGHEDYVLVTGEAWKTSINTSNVKSITDLKKVVEGVFTKDIAIKVFYSRYLDTKEEVGLPLYKEYQGQLYVTTHNGGHGSASKYFIDTTKIISQEGNVVVVEFNTTEYDSPYKMTVKIEKVNDKWLLASGANADNEVMIRYDYILKYQGKGSLWSAALEDTVWDFGNGKNKVYSRIILTYKGSDIKMVGKVNFTYGNAANRNKGTGYTLSSDGKIIYDEYDDNIVLPTKDDVVKVTVEWDGKQDSFVMSNSGLNNGNQNEESAVR